MSDLQPLLEPTEEDGLPADVREAIRYMEAGRLIVADPNAERIHKLLALAELGDRIRRECISPTLAQAALWAEVRAFVEMPPDQLPPPTCPECFRPLDAAETDRHRVLQLGSDRSRRRQP